MKQQQAAELNSYNQLLKTNLDTKRQDRRKTSNDLIVEEIKKTGISNFFTQSKPSFSTIGIFNTTEAAFLIAEITAQISKDKKKLAEFENGENTENSRISKSEKRPSIRDIRDLKELGACEHNPNMAKYMISFKASSTANNHAIIQISLIERILATKRMQNRETNLIEDVPTTKKQVKIMVIGTENDNGSFSWEKITNDISPEDATPKEPGKLAFDDSKSAGSLENLRLKFPLANSHPALKTK